MRLDLRHQADRLAGEGYLAAARPRLVGQHAGLPRTIVRELSSNYGGYPNDAERLLAGACPIVASYGGKDRSPMGTGPPGGWSGR